MAEELETKVEETVEATEVAENVETADNKKEAITSKSTIYPLSFFILFLLFAPIGIFALFRKNLFYNSKCKN